MAIMAPANATVKISRSQGLRVHRKDRTLRDESVVEPPAWPVKRARNETIPSTAANGMVVTASLRAPKSSFDSPVIKTTDRRSTDIAPAKVIIVRRPSRASP